MQLQGGFIQVDGEIWDEGGSRGSGSGGCLGDSLFENAACTQSGGDAIKIHQWISSI